MWAFSMNNTESRKTSSKEKNHTPSLFLELPASNGKNGKKGERSALPAPQAVVNEQVGTPRGNVSPAHSH